jgi:hypothetical protein
MNHASDPNGPRQRPRPSSDDLADRSRSASVDAMSAPAGDRGPTRASQPTAPSRSRFDGWKKHPSGLLLSGADIAEYVVAPLVELVWDAPHQGEVHPLDDRTLGPILRNEAQHDEVGFTIEYAVGRPALAIEVRSSIHTPDSWLDSTDFQQLASRMEHLGAPGLLADPEQLVLVRQGAGGPFARIERAVATWDDIAVLRDLILWKSKAASVLRHAPQMASTRRVAHRD